MSVQSVYGAKFVRKLCLKYSDKTKYEAIKSDTQRLKLLFPGTALSFDFLKKCFEFPGNLPPLTLLILRMPRTLRLTAVECGRDLSLQHEHIRLPNMFLSITFSYSI